MILNSKLFRALLLWIVPLVLMILCSLAFGYFGAEPKGSFESYPIFDHAPTDVIEFKHGTVMHRTCCGDYPWGTYSKRADGRWIWQLVNQERYRATPDGRRFPVREDVPGSRVEIETTTHEVEIQHGFWAIQLRCASDALHNRKLRRRLFCSVPF